MFEKIENFDNAAEFLLLKALFYTLWSLGISNCKIISHKIKQLRHVLKTMRIFAWSRYLQKLAAVRVIRRFIFNFFANQNFTRHRKAGLLRKWIALMLQAKLCFMGCLVKAKALVLGNIALSLSSQLIVLVFTKQPSAERYLANIFLPVFLWTFRKL